MLNNGVGRAALVAALLVLLAAGAWGRPGDSPRKDATEPKSARLTKLLKERLAILKQIAAAVEKAHRGGLVPLERVFEATEAVLNAEFDLCESDKERIAVHEKLVTLAKQREESIAKLVQSAAVPASALLKAKVRRLDAEIALERARQK
jgi:hypothetical protein